MVHCVGGTTTYSVRSLGGLCASDSGSRPLRSCLLSERALGLALRVDENGTGWTYRHPLYALMAHVIGRRSATCDIPTRTRNSIPCLAPTGTFRPATDSTTPSPRESLRQHHLHVLGDRATTDLTTGVVGLAPQARRRIAAVFESTRLEVQSRM